MSIQNPNPVTVPKYTNKDWLYQQKIEKNRHVIDIAKECNVSSSVISRWLGRYEITYKIHRRTFVLTCADCGGFYNSKGRKKSKDGKFRCKECYIKVHPLNREYHKAYRKNHPLDAAGKIKAKDSSLRCKYGLTIQDYNQLCESQKGVCSICKKKNLHNRSLSVDHNHTTSKIRGLLCDKCNRAIGVFNDDIKLLQNALIYLSRNEEDKSWDKYFISIASLVSTRSKDPSTQVGAVLVKDNVIISTGYNGFARGCNDSVLERYDRPLKYDWMVHAEENAIINSCREGVKTLGATLYVTPMRPCYKCARAIIQSGVKRVVCQYLFSDENWDKEFETSKQMFHESQVEYLEIV